MSARWPDTHEDIAGVLMRVYSEIESSWGKRDPKEVLEQAQRDIALLAQELIS